MEPLERGRVFAHPDKLDSFQSLGRIGPGTLVPDILQDAGPRGHADARADQYGDFIVEHVLGGRSVRPLDPDRGHFLSVLQGDFVHGVWVEGVVELAGLCWAGTQGVPDRTGPVADLPDVDAHVRVKGTRGDGEGVPLGGGYRGNIDQTPLARLIFHGRFGDLDLHHVVRMADHAFDAAGSTGIDFPVQPLDDVQAGGHQLPSPAFVSQAVIPERRPGKG